VSNHAQSPCLNREIATIDSIHLQRVQRSRTKEKAALAFSDAVMSNAASPHPEIEDSGHPFLAKNHTTSSSATVQISNRKLSSAYLDLTPLPENVLLDTMPTISSSFESNGDTGISGQVKSTRQWQQEEEDNIRKKLRGRLPSASYELKRSNSGGIASNHHQPTKRPSTAPVGASRTKYGVEPHSLRSARYLAMQWRSRATQWSSSSSLGGNKRGMLNDSLSTTSISTSQPPELTQVEDDYSSDASSDSEISHKSTASLDESTKSHISDAHSVVEVWKDRAVSISAIESGLPVSMSPTHATTSNGSQESAKTVKARGGRRLVLEAEESVNENLLIPDDPALSFAMRPGTLPTKKSMKNLLKTKKPLTPLQRITSGQEYQSSSQRLLEQFRSDSESIIEGNEMEYEGSGDMSNTNLSESSCVFSSTLSSIDGESSTLHNISLDGDESRGMSLPDINPLNQSSTSSESYVTANSQEYEEESEVGLHDSNHSSNTPVISTFVSPPANEMRRHITTVPRYTQAEMQKIASMPHSRKPVISTFIKTSKKDGGFKAVTTNSNEVTEAPKKRFIIPSIAEREENARRARAEKAANMKAKLEAEKAAKAAALENSSKVPKKRFVIPSIEEREEKARRERAEKAANMQIAGAGANSLQARLEAVKAAKSLHEKNQKLVMKNSSSSIKSQARKSLERKGSNASSIRSKDISVKSKSKSISSTTSNSTPRETPKWTTHYVTFTFGILTASNDAPPTGPYNNDDDHPSYKNKLITRSKLLHEVMNRFALITRRIKRLGHGKYLMFAPGYTPSIIRVDKDGEFYPLVILTNA